MKIFNGTRKRKVVVLAALVSLLSLVGGAAAQVYLVPYFSATNSFTVTGALQVSSATLAYDGGTAQTCTAGSGSTWTCPDPGTSTLFANDTLTYSLVAFSNDPHSETVQYAVLATPSTYTSFSTTSSMTGTSGGFTCTGLPSALPVTIPLIGTHGCPTGTNYSVTITVTMGAQAPSGTVSFDAELGTA